MTCDQGHTTSTDRFKAPALKGLSSIPSEKYTTEDSPWVKNKGYVIPNSRIIDALLNPGQEMQRNGEIYKLPRMRVSVSASGSINKSKRSGMRAVLTVLIVVLILAPASYAAVNRHIMTYYKAPAYDSNVEKPSVKVKGAIIRLSWGL